MAYADIGDVAAGNPVTETYLDQIRANFLAGVPDIFTTEGDIAVATGTDAATRLGIGTADSVLVAGAARPEWQIVPAVHVTNSGALLMTPEVWTSIAFDTETADTNAMHAPAPNPSRLTVPAGGDGWYTFGFNGNASRAATATAFWMARILLNGTTELACQRSTANRPAYINLSMSLPLAAGNFIEVQYYSDAVSDQSIAIGASFWAVWQRRA